MQTEASRGAWELNVDRTGRCGEDAEVSWSQCRWLSEAIHLSFAEHFSLHHTVIFVGKVFEWHAHENHPLCYLLPPKMAIPGPPAKYGEFPGLLPTHFATAVTQWLAEDTPSYDYGGFVVGSQ